jgi:hypothetical protein
MIELNRFQQLRPLQTLAEEDALRLGLPLYPDNSPSALAKALSDTNTSGAYKDELAGQAHSLGSLLEPKDLHPTVRSLYEWLAHKARPIRLDDFTSFIKTLKVDTQFELDEAWRRYADHFLVGIALGRVHINYCVDFQLLIRVCYIFRTFLKASGDQYAVDLSLTAARLDRLLRTPVLLPKRVLNSRCRRHCSDPPLETSSAATALATTHGHQLSCECRCDMICQKASRFCMCVRTYVADLFVIKETLARYEEGDIADIENILAGENKTRRHRTLTRTEEIREQETQSDTSEERDHQVDEKFGLQSEVKKASEDKVHVDAGVTSTIKYGDSFTLTPHADVTADFAKSESSATARSYSKELVDRAVTKIQEKVRRLQVTKALSELEERNKHSIDNTQAGAAPRAGIFYWVNKVSHAQVFNYGKHMMFDAILPEPAAMFKKLYNDKLKQDKAAQAPPLPDVTPHGIRRFDPTNPNDPQYYGAIVSKYGISSTEEMFPPAASISVEVAFSLNVPKPENGNAVGFSSNEFKTPAIPAGYAATMMYYDVRCSTGDPGSTGPNDEVAVSVNVGEHCILSKSLNEFHFGGGQKSQDWVESNSRAMRGEVDTLTVAVAGFSSMALSLSGSVTVVCDLTPARLEKWQTDIYNLIFADYNRKLTAYENASNRNDQLFQIKGRNPFLNREIERNEFRRLIVAMLMCNYFNGMGSMMERVAPCGYPEPDFEKLAKDAPIIQFFEQVFEWEYVNYLFYHSMWARKCKWVELIDEDSGDPLFDKFLMSGAARVQVPIRNGMEEIFQWFLDTGQMWGASGMPPIAGDPHYVSMIQEMKEAKQGNYSDRPGVVEVVNGSDQVLLTKSAFYWDLVGDVIDPLAIANDVDREILIDFKIYRIVAIDQTNAGDNTAWTITIDEPYPGTSAKNLKHAVGAVFVGAPWEVVIPTKLVYLRNQADKLPTYPLP